MIDISVIINGVNSSLEAAIAFCKSCNVIVEVLEDQMNAKGDYVAVCDTFSYYEPNYLHYQWVALEYRNKNCDRFRTTKAVVFDDAHKEFYVGDASNHNIFYRRVSEVKKSKYFKESQYFLFATLAPLKEIQEVLPDDKALVKYHNFFSKLLINE